MGGRKSMAFGAMIPPKEADEQEEEEKMRLNSSMILNERYLGGNGQFAAFICILQSEAKNKRRRRERREEIPIPMGENGVDI